MAEAIYLLCALTSIACVVLLTRSWLRHRSGLLLWSMIGFAGLAVNNCLLVLDLAVFTQVDFGLWRNATALLGIASLLAGLIWETT
jgi:hypothetical protein